MFEEVEGLLSQLVGEVQAHVGDHSRYEDRERQLVQQVNKLEWDVYGSDGMGGLVEAVDAHDQEIRHLATAQQRVLEGLQLAQETLDRHGWLIDRVLELLSIVDGSQIHLRPGTVDELIAIHEEQKQAKAGG